MPAIAAVMTAEPATASTYGADLRSMAASLRGLAPILRKPAHRTSMRAGDLDELAVEPHLEDGLAGFHVEVGDGGLHSRAGLRRIDGRCDPRPALFADVLPDDRVVDDRRAAAPRRGKL